MAKLLALCATLVALAVIAESKSISIFEEPCHACIKEASQRTKRNAPEVLNSVSNLVHGILDISWSHIARLNAQKLAAQRRPQTVIIGPGENNNNRVMFNSGGGRRNARRRQEYDYYSY